jgi:hypothetical protein
VDVAGPNWRRILKAWQPHPLKGMREIRPLQSRQQSNRFEEHSSPHLPFQNARKPTKTQG